MTYSPICPARRYMLSPNERLHQWRKEEGVRRCRLCGTVEGEPPVEREPTEIEKLRKELRRKKRR